MVLRFQTATSDDSKTKLPRNDWVFSAIQGEGLNGYSPIFIRLPCVICAAILRRLIPGVRRLLVESKAIAWMRDFEIHSNPVPLPCYSNGFRVNLPGLHDSIQPHWGVPLSTPRFLVQFS